LAAGFFLKSRSEARDRYRKEDLSARVDHALTGIVQNKRLSFLHFPKQRCHGRVLSLRSGQQKNQPENLVSG
jgi:hypothetical protein